MLNSVCGMRLSTYGVGLGWIGVIFSFLAVILTSIGLGNADELARQIVEENHNTKLTVDEVRTILVIILSIYLALQVINLLASGMLIVGTLKERHLYLLPWLFNNGVTLIFGIITQIGMWVQLSSVSFTSALPSILVSLVTITLSWYLYYGIYSLYKQIQRTSDLQRPLIPPQSSARNYEGLPNNQ
ncbi:uncharacterized protein LOC110184089 [Drosophila serrata]|uniref:uncharacterized protein LOC110184089 n=1 Tax=Drosophila serrata TaxID=7274 RepID=UPI000A1D0DC8|nr:uncharacterized protein LOC110184089 [Drosophila serrata]KAH8369517.1 hypothetical protein KR200_006978 [Drosophila serrata]